MRANTPQGTAAELALLGPDSIWIATNGGGPDTPGGPAGWGATAARREADSSPKVTADLWGPVVTDPESPYFFGCTAGTNNTGEITGIEQALR